MEAEKRILKIGHVMRPAPPVQPPADVDKQPTKSENILQPKPLEPFKPTEESYIEKPFIPPKPIPHSPKISPSSIPNPSPSVTTTKQVEAGYPNYGGYLYSIPGYSAFQPISYPGIMQPNQAPISMSKEVPTPMTDYMPYPPKPKDLSDDKSKDIKNTEVSNKVDLTKPQTEFDDKFIDKTIAPVVTLTEGNNLNESKMSITSLAQGSGATVTIPSLTTNKDLTKKKIPERFSLKTSIPISKIDMKCVTTPSEPVFQNSLSSKGPSAFTSTFQMQKCENQSRVEIQSNIVIKTALKDADKKVESTQATSAQPTNINTLLNAAETAHKNDTTFKKPEPKQEVIDETKDPPPNFPTPLTNSPPKPLFNPLNVETCKAFPNKPLEGYNDQKNQILFIQNKNQNPKMLVAIQQQNPQVLLQRTNFDSKNLLAPSRLSKRSKEDSENGASSKVVALKRLHQENYDENDFENLITENQIYGNKIVVKEKSPSTLQEQDIKNKKFEKLPQGETKNVVLQPNFLYLSNVQFPNLMMIKNNNKLSQNIDYKNGATDKLTNEVSTMTTNNDAKGNSTSQNNAKEFHVLKSNNTNQSSNDLVFQTPHQKVIMNPQFLYQVPMIVDTDNKLNQQFINRDYPKFISQNKKEFDKQNDKLFIACPYQMDSKLQPKIVITNIRPKIAKIEEVSSLDIYEKRRRLRRLKYLTHRETKEKVEVKKNHEKVGNFKNIITPSKMKAEICKEFAKSKLTLEGASESESDYGDDDLNEYNNIINDYGKKADDLIGKAEFLANFRLATHEVYKDKELDLQERTIRRDSIASAYIAAGRLDRLTNDNTDVTKPADLKVEPTEDLEIKPEMKMDTDDEENGITKQKKQFFLSQLHLLQVSKQFKEGYATAWHVILKERKRRNGSVDKKKPLPKLEENLDPNGQLKLLTEIKKCVLDNNNLIKKRLDSTEENNEGDSIHLLAEKNFTELTRLSKLADSSVKLITGQDTRRRDLNPGFDSENIQKQLGKVNQPFLNVPQINIPNISAIISLKTNQDRTVVTMTSQATSMDEPQNSAAGVNEMFEKSPVKGTDVSCQVDDMFPWPGVEAMMKSFKEYDAGRKREINELHRRNTLLRVEGAHITRAASQHSERARALLAERQNLANEENNVTLSLQRLCSAIEVVRNSV